MKKRIKKFIKAHKKGLIELGVIIGSSALLIAKINDLE